MKMENFTSNVFTKSEYWIEEWNMYINTISIPLFALNTLCLLILSCIWSYRFIYQLINDHRILKNVGRQTDSAAPGKHSAKVSKYKIHINVKLFNAY